MATEADRGSADHALRVALTHPECRGGELLDPDGARERIRIDMNVEMPLHLKTDGISSSGVRTIESVIIKFPVNYPWKSPRFFLRDFIPPLELLSLPDVALDGACPSSSSVL